jgi:hypothetical protein
MGDVLEVPGISDTVTNIKFSREFSIIQACSSTRKTLPYSCFPTFTVVAFVAVELSNRYHSCYTYIFMRYKRVRTLL